MRTSSSFVATFACCLALPSFLTGCDALDPSLGPTEPCSPSASASCASSQLSAAKADGAARVAVRPSCGVLHDEVLAAPPGALADAIADYLRAQCDAAALRQELGAELVMELEEASTSGLVAAQASTSALAEAIAQLGGAGGTQDMQYCNWHMCVWIVGDGGSCHIVWCDESGFCQWQCG